MPIVAPPRVLTTTGAERLGLTAAQVRTELRRQRWQRMAAGILLTRPDEPTRDDWITAGLIIGGPGAALSGWDAVRLCGIGDRRPPAPTVLVIVGSGRHRVVGRVHVRPSDRPIRTIRRSPWDETLPGAVVATPARAIADTALLHDRFDPVRAMVTAAIQRRLCSPEELLAELDAGPRNGSGHLRRALLDVGAGALSIAEAEAIDLLRGIGETSFVANAEIRGPDGAVLCVVDLLWPELRAIVEIDSREFHFREQDWKLTMARHNLLTSLGYAVTHYPPSVVRTGGPAWAREVANWLASRRGALGLAC